MTLLKRFDLTTNQFRVICLSNLTKAPCLIGYNISISTNFSLFFSCLNLSISCEFLGIDLALLAQANHSIMTYGTFGLWGALLAGGKVVFPKSHQEFETLKTYLRPANLSNCFPI